VVFGIKSEMNYQNLKSTVKIENKKNGVINLDELPNIYYIILDGYPREDVLQELYHYDNSNFLNYLKNKGFYIAPKSRSNYCQTSLSLTSSLNFDYLEKIINLKDINTNNRVPLEKVLKDNRLFHYLKEFGYKIIANESDYDFTNMTNADIFFSTNRWMSNEFQNTMINTTFLSFVFSKILTQYSLLNLHMKRMQSAFDHLSDPPPLIAPYFFFTHILSPHPYTKGIESPMYDGSHYYEATKETVDQYRMIFIERLESLNIKMKQVIDRILLKSDRPNIIVLQADHGPGSELNWDDAGKSNFKERLSILNAYYLPKRGEKYCYSDITPVNTFRIILNHYFGTQYDLLEDRCYFSTWTLPYKFIEWKYNK
jgi:hypothetical protein